METTDILLYIALGICIGVWLFYFTLKLIIRRLLARIENDLEEALEKHQEEKTIPCRVELHNAMFFVYNNETNEFMAQGKDLKELREHIKFRWADKKVSVVAGEENVLDQLRAQLNESSSSQ